MNVIVDGILNVLNTNGGVVAIVLSALGTLLVIATTVDSLVDDSIDSGYSKKLLNVPVLGVVLKSLMRFSVLRNKKPNE